MEKTPDHMDSIQFKPLSEGLGLNHFADGLPYSPANRTRRPLNAPFPSQEIRRQPSYQGQQTFAYPQPQAAVAAPVASVAVAVEAEPASLWRRVFSFVFDAFMAMAIFASIVWASFAMNGYDIGALLMSRTGVQFVGPFFLLYVVIHLSYFLIQEITWHKTIGKAIFGIELRAGSGFAVLARVVCFFVAALPLGIGLMWYFFDHRHRCWHDVITDSEVVIS